jgi:hypothetical protein
MAEREAIPSKSTAPRHALRTTSGALAWRPLTRGAAAWRRRWVTEIDHFSFGSANGSRRCLPTAEMGPPRQAPALLQSRETRRRVHRRLRCRHGRVGTARRRQLRTLARPREAATWPLPPRALSCSNLRPSRRAQWRPGAWSAGRAASSRGVSTTMVCAIHEGCALPHDLDRQGQSSRAVAFAQSERPGAAVSASRRRECLHGLRGLFARVLVGPALGEAQSSRGGG